VCGEHHVAAAFQHRDLSAFMGTATTEDQLRVTAEALDCADACGVNLPDALANLTDWAFMIVVQDFQDPYTLNVKQLMKCCVEEITPDGRLIPFCAYNSVGYANRSAHNSPGSRSPTWYPTPPSWRRCWSTRRTVPRSPATAADAR
jgi:hypothetical protein